MDIEDKYIIAGRLTACLRPAIMPLIPIERVVVPDIMGNQIAGGKSRADMVMEFSAFKKVIRSALSPDSGYGGQGGHILTILFRAAFTYLPAALVRNQIETITKILF